MGLFSRNKNQPPPSLDPKLSELGRDYAIARRHRDRRTMNRIVRQVEKEYGPAGADWTSFEEGQQAYDDIPPAYTKPRRGKRR